jgi:hypothetical protein
MSLLLLFSGAGDDDGDGYEAKGISLTEHRQRLARLMREDNEMLEIIIASITTGSLN